ncbi:unnamed protein product [Spirodela intermedia]|uniref:Dof zinc finger protein n=1 Tax=Spirodela intermedia TaxID=51605 RepID=A0A7I8KL39_SPIIN|nr:unnamed protein product [Spirodela intermedia]
MAVAPPPLQQERGARAPAEQAARCPRCESTDTKFCYYNNYSLSQPRYFCKACRRFWTRGGSLRNIPMGGGSRKTRRPLSFPSSRKIPRRQQPHAATPLPPPPAGFLLDRQTPSFVGCPLYGISGQAAAPHFWQLDSAPAAAAIRELSSCRNMDGDGNLLMGMGDGNLAVDPGRDFYWHGLVNSFLF